MRIFIYFFVGLILLQILSCSNDSATSNQSKLVLNLDLLQSSVNLEDEAQIDILIEECSEPIFGICMQIEFDHEILSFFDSNTIITGDFFGENQITFAQESDGIIYLTITLTQSEELVSGNGSLCSIFIEAINTGTSDIKILTDSISIYDQNGNSIEFDTIETNNTEITVL